MSAGELDFAAPGTPAVARVLLVLGIVSVLVAGAVIGRAMVDVERARRVVDALRPPPPPVPAAPPLAPAAREQLQATGRELAFDWAAVFRRLAARRPPDVTLLSLEPVPARNLLRLEGESRGFDAMFAFAEAMGDDRGGAPATIESWQVPEGRGVRFRLVAPLEQP